MTVRELVRPPSRAFSLSTLKKLSRSEGSYVENTYTGGSADSESPVALRPSLARGLPFRLLTKQRMTPAQMQVKGLTTIGICANRAATIAPPEKALKLQIGHNNDQRCQAVVGRSPRLEGGT